MKVLTGRPTLPMTYHEYALLPQDRNRYEVLDGELYMTPSPTYLQQHIVTYLASMLLEHVSARKLGEVLTAPMDVLLSESNIVQPDVLFIRTNRVPARDAKNITVAPDLIVEVLSPSSVEQDRETKKAVYARHGVPHYWIIDPQARTLEMYSLAVAQYELAAELRGDATATSPLFPGLTIPLARLWA